MDNFELCDRLVAKAGVSYAQAKSALERSGWDLLDAMILLEKEGTVPSSASGTYSSGEGTSADASCGPRESGGGGENTADACSRTYSSCCDEKAARREEHFRRREENREKRRNFFGRVWAFLTENRVVAYNNTGREVLNIPVWVAIVIFCCTFWISIFAILFSFVKGWQYRFLGPDLGKDNFNRAAAATGQAVYRAGQDIKESFSDSKSGPVDVEYEVHDEEGRQ